jgi:hypothetical protein
MRCIQARLLVPDVTSPNTVYAPLRCGAAFTTMEKCDWCHHPARRCVSLLCIGEASRDCVLASRASAFRTVLVSGPPLAIDRSPGLSCLIAKPPEEEQ